MGLRDRDGTSPNKKKKHLQTRKNISEQEKNISEQEKNISKQEKNISKQEKKTSPNKKNTFRARKIPFEQGKRLSSKGYLPIKCKSLQVVGVSGQGKAVVSDGG